MSADRSNFEEETPNRNSKYIGDSKYIDLKINGKLFPSWILANFKKYKLPEVFLTDEDPCNQKRESGNNDKIAVNKMRKYQEFITKFMDFKSPYKNILLYHGLGSGKTSAAINTYNMLYSYTPGWNVFILLKASLRRNWQIEIEKWLKKDDYSFRYKNIIFINYDSPVADSQFMDAVKNVDSSKKSLYMIEEAHNFINNVHSNITSEKGRRAITIYDYIIQDKKSNPDTRVILLSGTPAINNPFQLGLLFNLLRPGLFPDNENEFNGIFLSNETFKSLNKKNKNLFQRRIMGLVSYYAGADPRLYAKKVTNYVDVEMSEYHENVYNHYEEIEKKKSIMRVSSKSSDQSYLSYTRQACNFVFPQISNVVNGEDRPRPNKFKISERDALKLAEANVISELKSGKIILDKVEEYKKIMNLYIEKLISHFNEIDAEDEKNNYTILSDLKLFVNDGDRDVNFSEFRNNGKKKSKLFSEMEKCSSKILNIIFNVMRSEGPVVIYSNYVKMEGIEIIKIYLGYLGFYNYMSNFTLDKSKIGYIEFHGGIKDQDDRYKGMRAYNEPENKFGDLIKIILISAAGSEGLSLENVRQVHILEPHWNETRIIQLIGRAVRQCSHKSLPMEKRIVDVYRYRSVKKPDPKNPNKQTGTTDVLLDDISRNKQGMIISFFDAMKEVAIDCELNKNDNKFDGDMSCFKFDEKSLFSKNVGPAYRENIYDDMRMNSGSNSVNSIVKKVKTRKIDAVIEIENISNEIKYSNKKKYWLDDNTGIIYDYDLYYTYGMIKLDEDKIPDRKSVV